MIHEFEFTHKGAASYMRVDYETDDDGHFLFDVVDLWLGENRIDCSDQSTIERFRSVAFDELTENLRVPSCL